MDKTNQFPYLLEKYFTGYLLNQRNVSKNTVASYRDTMRIFCIYSSKILKKKISEIVIEDIDDNFIISFLNHIEKNRDCSISSRNQRLMAIRSFYRYVSFIALDYSQKILKILTIPIKKYEKKMVDYLEDDEIEALLASPDQGTQLGRRDYTILTMFIQTGMRISEILSLRIRDIIFEKNAYVHCTGKGRKERNTPINKGLKQIVEQYLKERQGNPDDVIFPSRLGRMMSRDSVEYLLHKYVQIAQKTCDTLKNKNISPHSLRHTNAMLLLSAGVDCPVISLWLGHASLNTTKIYLNTGVKYRQKIIDKYGPFKQQKVPRFKADDKLLTYLNSL